MQPSREHMPGRLNTRRSVTGLHLYLVSLEGGFLREGDLGDPACMIRNEGIALTLYPITSGGMTQAFIIHHVCSLQPPRQNDVQFGKCKVVQCKAKAPQVPRTDLAVLTPHAGCCPLPLESLTRCRCTKCAGYSRLRHCLSVWTIHYGWNSEHRLPTA